jgi:cytochrome b involved in lipid metabolism
MHGSAEEWIQWAKQQHRYIMFHEERVIDVTEFMQAHPGGKKALISYIYKDITDILFKVYKHPKEQTLATLRQYVIGVIAPTDRSKTVASKTRSPIGKAKKKVCFQ